MESDETGIVILSFLCSVYENQFLLIHHFASANIFYFQSSLEQNILYTVLVHTFILRRVRNEADECPQRGLQKFAFSRMVYFWDMSILYRLATCVVATTLYTGNL